MIESSAAATKAAAEEAEEEAKNKLAETQATAKALAAESSEQAKAKKLESTRNARLASEEGGTMNLLQEDEFERSEDKSEDKSAIDEKNFAENFAENFADVRLRASMELYEQLSSMSLVHVKEAERHMEDMRKWNNVAAQLEHDYNDYLRLADRTQERIDTGGDEIYFFFFFENSFFRDFDCQHLIFSFSHLSSPCFSLSLSLSLSLSFLLFSSLLSLFLFLL